MVIMQVLLLYAKLLADGRSARAVEQESLPTEMAAFYLGRVLHGGALSNSFKSAYFSSSLFLLLKKELSSSFDCYIGNTRGAELYNMAKCVRCTLCNQQKLKY